MAISKVVFGNNTLIDITDSDVTPDNLLLGNTGYKKDGSKVQGNVGIKVEGNKLIFNGPIFSVSGRAVVIGNSVSGRTLNLI